MACDWGAVKNALLKRGSILRERRCTDPLQRRPRRKSARQIQPQAGTEKVFGQALREDWKNKGVSQEQQRP
jgi:hypothetical protein